MKDAKKAHGPQMMQRQSKHAAALLKEMANANRLMILCLLATGEKTVSEIAESIDLSQSAVSQHLSRLRSARLVASDKRGLSVFYKVSSQDVQAILSVLYLIYCR